MAVGIAYFHQAEVSGDHGYRTYFWTQSAVMFFQWGRWGCKIVSGCSTEQRALEHLLNY